MNRQRIECFIALAEELHFHRAAARCHMSQPAMSQQIKQLERDLGVQLAIRSKRTVMLTPAGEVFLIEARKTIRQLDLAISLARRTDSGEIGQLSIGVTSPALYVLFPEVARAFRRRLPDVGLLVQEMTTAEQEEALRNNDIQVGLLHPPLDDENLTCELVAQPAFAIVLGHDHHLANRRSVKLAELAQEQFILFPREIGPQLYDIIIALCQSAGFSPKIVLEAHPAQSIIALAAAGMGIGFIAAPVQQLTRPGVVYVPLEGPRPLLNLGVAYPRDSNSPAVLTFVDSARKIGQTMVRRDAGSGVTGGR